MKKGMIWTVLGVIVAIVIAWIAVDVVLKLVFFAAKLVVVAIVALIVFFVLRSFFARRDA